MKLREVAHCRAGDKGNISNISVIAYKEEAWDFIKNNVTVDIVRQAFGEIVQGEIIRYELPKICALNFVLKDALAGGVTTSLSTDIHGKSLSSIMLNIDLRESVHF